VVEINGKQGSFDFLERTRRQYANAAGPVVEPATETETETGSGFGSE
jgi:hypothetical protein